MKIARLTLSDRASAGIYEDLSGPEIERILTESGFTEIEWHRHKAGPAERLARDRMRHGNQGVGIPAGAEGIIEYPLNKVV